MIVVSDTIKESYNKFTTQRKSYIQIGDNSFFIQNLDVQADAYNDGNVIGNAIAKIAKFDIETENVKGIEEFELFDGIWTGNQYEYISLGKFKLFDEEGTDDFFSSITAYDKLIDFNKQYIPNLISFPISLYDFLKAICQQAGIELENASIPNGDKVLTANLFVENETLKLILNSICQISGNYAIISNNKLKLLLKGEEKIVLSKYQISSPEFKRTTWKINQVILGMSDIDGEYSIRQDKEDIEKNGIHKLVINDNPFVYSQSLREEYIDALFEQVKGFGYEAFKTNWEGISYVELGDLLEIDGHESIVLRYNIKSPKGLESTLEAPSIIDSVVTYVDNSNSISNRQKRTEIIVDKQNQQIKSITEKVVDVSNAIKGIGSLTLENAYEGVLHKLVITGNISLKYPSSGNDLYGYSLFPSEKLTPKANLTPSAGIPFNHDVLYPSDTLYPKSFKLQVDKYIYDLDINYLNYINENVCDEFIYEDGSCYIIRRVGINENGEMYQLPNEIYEEKNDLFINVLENSIITLLGFDNAILNAEYLLQNQYTNVFATEAYVNSEIKQTADEINIEVAKKVNEDEVVSKINLSPEQVLLKGNRVIIESDNFDLDASGKITATAGEIGGFDMNSQSLSKVLTGTYEYNQFDSILAGMSILNRISKDSNLTKVLDVNNDNNVNSADYVTIKNIIGGTSENTKILNGIFEVNSSDPKNCISIKDDTGEIISSLGLGGINSTYITCNNFVCGYPSDKVDTFIGASINGKTGNITCV